MTEIEQAKRIINEQKCPDVSHCSECFLSKKYNCYCTYYAMPILLAKLFLKENGITWMEGDK